MAIKLKPNVLRFLALLAAIFVLDGIHKEQTSSTVDKNDKTGGLAQLNNMMEGHRNLRYQDVLSVKEDHSPSWRILTLGSSVTWGAGMVSRYNAYPYLLSPNVTNLALRAQGPSYPAICAQSMIGNDAIYDLIILEFYQRAHDGLLHLTKRLRQRFPKATIVIIRRWQPLMVINKKTQTHFRDWAKKEGFTSLHAPELRETLFATTQADDWLLARCEAQRGIQDQAVQDYGAILYDMPFNEQDPREIIAEQSNLFSSDFHHYSAEGHAYIANGILQTLREKGVAVQRNDELGSWGDGDVCDTWFESGETSVEHSENIEMKLFTRVKHSLELPTADLGYISITNPFDAPRELFLSYMGTDPPSKYPKTRAHLLKGGNINRQSIYREVDLDPTTTDYTEHVHVGLSTSLGMVPPGKTTVLFRTLEENKEYPFRLLGYAISSEKFAGSVFQSL
mmetsp:Transcript_1843/g.2579  ORF Transcript_1843/g.2579 Transcript_1843/m.2579 type:complete len:450 (-) Transcript_1843:142-1491(-)